MTASREITYIDSVSQWWSVLRDLTHQNRFVLDPRPLKELMDVCTRRITTLARGTRLYRSRITPPAEPNKEVPFPIADMGAPRPHQAIGGRLNPEGIPYLYLAKEPLTAVAETRPWRGATIAVATFELAEDLEVYDVTSPPPEAGSLDDFIIRNLGKAFSTPAHRDDRTAYGATQFISEQLKAVGAGRIRGIQYPSALQPNGVNVALFSSGDRGEEWSSVLGFETRLWTVSAVNIEANPKT